MAGAMRGCRQRSRHHGYLPCFVLLKQCCREFVPYSIVLKGMSLHDGPIRPLLRRHLIGGALVRFHEIEQVPAPVAGNLVFFDVPSGARHKSARVRPLRAAVAAVVAAVVAAAWVLPRLLRKNVSTWSGFPQRPLSLVSDWLLKVRTPFWSESYCYLCRAIDFAGFSHAIH